ncbi:MAG TPA: Hpt domain-containing protein [Bacteroidales bacterium]|nr:Hpt domain-containing protein [Bacteroidales bacterium]
MEYKSINPDYLETVSGGDSEIIKEIVDMFTEQSSEAYTQMLSLLEKGNFYDLGMLAHKMKSSVAIMGMDDLATMLKTFEIQTKDGKNSESYGAYIERFRNDTEIAISELTDYINNRLK